MPYIPTESVDSSNIQAIGYDRKHQGGTVRIIFKEDRVYDYPDFPEREWDKFRNAESLGKYFRTYIRTMYAHRTITREEELTPPCCDHENDESPSSHGTPQCHPLRDINFIRWFLGFILVLLPTVHSHLCRQ